MSLSQKQSLKKGLYLSPKQLIEQNLLQLSSVELIEKIQKEVEENPALEEIAQPTDQNEMQDQKESVYEVNNDGEYEEKNPQKEYSPEVGYIDAISSERTHSLYDILETQVPQINITSSQIPIAQLIIGNLDENGYFVGECSSISDQIKFEENKDITPTEVDAVLQKIQQLDPPGIGARSIQESLQIQINRNTKEKKAVKALAKKIVTLHFDLLSDQNIEALRKNLGTTKEDTLLALQFIRRLNPSPGRTLLQSKAENQMRIDPDFSVITEGDSLKISLHEKYIPRLSINKQFLPLDRCRLSTKQKKEAATFVTQHIQRASFFLQALQMRKKTLQKIINAVAKIQEAYFTSGDESLIVPMLLHDVAVIVNRDISTISRAVTNKYVATNWGIKMLRTFFNQQVKNRIHKTKTKYNIQEDIKEIIEKEDKATPYTDQEIADSLREKGYHLSRRSILSYRGKMQIPASHDRRRS